MMTTFLKSKKVEIFHMLTDGILYMDSIDSISPFPTIDQKVTICIQNRSS